MPTECSRNSNCSKSRQRKDKFPYARYTLGGRFFCHLGEIRSPCAREAKASSSKTGESGLRTVAHAVFPHCRSCFLVGDLRNNQVRASQRRAIHEAPISRNTGGRCMKGPRSYVAIESTNQRHLIWEICPRRVVHGSPLCFSPPPTRNMCLQIPFSALFGKTGTEGATDGSERPL
jgi:hypothetical protein